MKRLVYFWCTVLIGALLLPVSIFGQEIERKHAIQIRVAGWNMEGNGNDIDPALLEEQLGEKENIDIWGLSEVRPTLFDEFEQGAEEGEDSDFKTVKGTSGNNILLAIIYDTSAVDLLDQQELDDAVFATHRAPLVAHFRGQRSGQEFLFMVNHLARGSADARLAQATFLNKWASNQNLPVIAVGDYNLDFHIERGDFGDRDPAFDAMSADGHFEWLRPRTLVKTQANDNFMTVLDFVFVANVEPFQEMGWNGMSRILGRSGDFVATAIDFDDSRDESDHRPVDAIFTLAQPTIEDPAPNFSAIEARLLAIEETLAELRVLLMRLLEE